MTIEKSKATPVKLGGTKGKLVRFSYLHVFTPQVNRESGKLEYSVQLHIPKANVEDVALLNKAIADQTAEYIAAVGVKGPEFHNPLKDGDTLRSQTGQPKFVPGHWVLSCKTAAIDPKGLPNAAPGVVGTTRGQDGMPLPIGANQIKSGDWGRVSLNLKFYPKGKGGVGCYLNGLQMVREGDALSARQTAAQQFADYEDEEDEALLA